MRVKHNKKNLKHKDIENNTTTQYEEKYNDVILNDLVPEDRKEEFNIQENEHIVRRSWRRPESRYHAPLPDSLSKRKPYPYGQPT